MSGYVPTLWTYERGFMSAETEESSELVVKSNKLIEASYRLTMVEQQLVLFAICQAREQQQGLSATSSVAIEARSFAKQFNLNTAMVYAQLKEATATLWGRQIVVHDVNPKNGKARVIKTRWISDIAYTDGAGVVEFTFAPKVIPFITRLEREFTSYRLERIGRMSSVHAVRIYELLVQYLTMGVRKFELGELKEMLGVAHEYNVINDFKKRVLDVAVSQINEHSDLKVAYSQTKTGRAVTGITFSIKSKTKALASPKKPKAPAQIGLPLEESPSKSSAPEVVAAIAETKKALNEMKKKKGLRVVEGGRKSP